MTTVRVDSAAPFGNMSNTTIASIHDAAEKIGRLNSSVANAESGYTGTPGAQFEDLPFGVTADPANAGKNGSAWAYAIQQLATEWNTFMTNAKAYIDTLDNG